MSPATIELNALGATEQLTAQVLDQNGQAMAGASVTWTSSAASVATVSTTGLVTAAGNGAATITATAGGVSGSATATVAQRVDAVAVAPAAGRLVAGDTLRLMAEATDANGHVVAGAEFVWASGDTKVAAVDAAGLVTGVGEGEVEVTATSSGVSGIAALVVVVVSSVTVSPAADTIAVSDTLHLTATARDPNGHMVDGVEFSWSSSDAPVATVDGSGLVRGIVEGVATITAKAGNARGTSRITVENPDRAALAAFFQATGGSGWENNENWLTRAPLGEWHGVKTDSHGRVVELRLGFNGLSGRIPPEIARLTNLGVLVITYNPDLGGSIIPPELGELRRLTRLFLNGNDLTGRIPPELGKISSLQALGLSQNSLTGTVPTELGDLSNLHWLFLGTNGLTGEIPPELGDLPLYRLALDRNRLTGEIPSALTRIDRLEGLYLGWNQLTGSIPPELGAFSRLVELSLPGNALTGSIPPELGALQNLEELDLFGNTLEGNLPAEFAQMSRLRILDVGGNSEMSGALPSELTALRLDALRLGDTGMCIPRDNEFRKWLLAIPDARAPLCAVGRAAAYLTQAVQSLYYPVSLVAGEDALLRVFIKTDSATDARIPPMRATFFEDGQETYVADVPGQTAPIPTRIDEGSLEASANVTIPGSVLVPGLEMVVEVDPGGTLDPGLDVQKRIPETGSQSAGVREVPVFELVVVPFLIESNPDSSIIDVVNELSPDHELFEMTRTLLPVGEMEMTAHEPVWTSSSDVSRILGELRLLKVAEGGNQYYLGSWRPRMGGGLASIYAGVAVADFKDWIVAHELGHTFRLLHAPCGNPLGVDPKYPYSDGTIGAWGYDSRSDTLVPPATAELMGYCDSHWISDYHFSKAMGHRLTTESGESMTASSEMSLLLWGGANPDGELFLEPAFVVDAPPALPERDGTHRVSGLDESDNEIFSLSFNMDENTDGDGGSSFAFAVPIRSHWADALARITLSGPGGASEMDRDGGSATALLLDPATGRVRGILRDWPTEGLPGVDMESYPPAATMDVQVSRGIPRAAAWRR
ncbi:MAG: Ig-like domain-containing protein [Gemmatimonadota bacterium]|nr:Ig-like domain-containing protein [Gemmatimonadota bacterium]